MIHVRFWCLFGVYLHEQTPKFTKCYKIVKYRKCNYAGIYRTLQEITKRIKINYEPKGRGFDSLRAYQKGTSFSRSFFIYENQCLRLFLFTKRKRHAGTPFSHANTFSLFSQKPKLHLSFAAVCKRIIRYKFKFKFFIIIFSRL